MGKKDVSPEESEIIGNLLVVLLSSISSHDKVKKFEIALSKVRRLLTAKKILEKTLDRLGKNLESSVLEAIASLETVEQFKTLRGEIGKGNTLLERRVGSLFQSFLKNINTPNDAIRLAKGKVLDDNQKMQALEKGLQVCRRDYKSYIGYFKSVKFNKLTSLFGDKILACALRHSYDHARCFYIFEQSKSKDIKEDALFRGVKYLNENGMKTLQTLVRVYRTTRSDETKEYVVKKFQEIFLIKRKQVRIKKDFLAMYHLYTMSKSIGVGIEEVREIMTEYVSFVLESNEKPFDHLFNVLEKTPNTIPRWKDLALVTLEKAETKESVGIIRALSLRFPSILSACDKRMQDL